MKINQSKIACGIRSAILIFTSSLIAGGVVADEASLEELKMDYSRPDSIPFPADNPYTDDKSELGRMLFFDPRLSGNNSMSCASCHNPGFAWGDGLALGIGSEANTLGRRTPTILNLAWEEALMWDGRFETLEEQAVGPMFSPAEMNQGLE